MQHLKVDNMDVVTTSHRSLQHQRDPNTFGRGFNSSPGRIMSTHWHSVDMHDNYSNKTPPVVMATSCSQQERLTSRHASIDEPVLTPRGQSHDQPRLPGTHGHSSRTGPVNGSHHSASDVRQSTSSSTIPNKKKCSVFSIPNERYALDASSTKDHENEDEFLVYPNYASLCLCVFDGHDGPNAVKFVKRYMKTNIFDTKSWINISQLDNREEIETALIEFIKVTDADFFKNIRPFIEEKLYLQAQIPKGMKSYQAQQSFPVQVARLQELESQISGGCTAVVAVLTSSRLYVANVGDSRAVLAYEEGDGSLQVKQLSVDHGVENEQELQRLTAIGLDQEQLLKTGRVGTQENTRSIGDYSIKGGYKDVDVLSQATDEPGIAVPHVTSVPINPAFKYLILMSDGVYKAIEAISGGQDGNRVIVTMIEHHLLKFGWDNTAAMHILKKIRQIQYDLYQRSARENSRSPAAVANRKRDDMTLVIYKFDI